MCKSTLRRGAFTLMELLVVVGIIGLLVGILLPSMSAARNSAKKSKVTMLVKSLGDGLQMFYNDTGDFPSSRKQFDLTDIASSGDDPLGRQVDHPGNNTVMWGAHHLARAMVGKDNKGYVDGKRARKYDRSLAPTEWYDIPSEDYESLFPREKVYHSEEEIFWRTSATPDSFEKQLGGVRPGALANNQQWVIVDIFERPVLYYKANPRGRWVAGTEDGGAPPPGMPDYEDDPTKLPYYNHLDNDLFTGHEGTSQDSQGWRFGPEDHWIKHEGYGDRPDRLPPSGSWRNTFSKYIHNHKIGLDPAAEDPVDMHPSVVEPYNKDSFLLITAGIDGIYGSNDDITNFDRHQ